MKLEKNMRKLLIKELIKLNRNKKIYLIINDLGFSVIEPFKDKFPNRTFNAGVSEQNMMGMAAGIASEKCNVFVYSIANFSTFRCAEQIRNDIDYHKLPVTIVSVGSGVGYGNLGYTHHALQDYSLMRSFPNMLILSPGSNNELVSILNYIKKNPQPSYLRLDKNEHKDEIFKKINVSPGKIIKLINGSPKKIILTTGSVQDIARNMISKRFKDYSLYSMPLWGMKAKNVTKKIIKKFDEIITIEDHFYDGGFGSWIKECTNNTNIKTKIKSKYIDSNVINEVGSKEYLLKKFGPK
jgi:transketolase